MSPAFIKTITNVTNVVIHYTFTGDKITTEFNVFSFQGHTETLINWFEETLCRKIQDSLQYII